MMCKETLYGQDHMYGDYSKGQKCMICNYTEAEGKVKYVKKNCIISTNSFSLKYYEYYV